MFKKWIQVLQNPKTVFEKEKNKANLEQAIKIVGLAGLISGILTAITIFIGFTAMPGVPPMLSGFQNMMGLAMILIIPIMAIIGLIIGSGIHYIFAKIFGGTGSYTVQTYLIALYTAPIMVLTYLLALIPILGALISLLLGLYSIYLLILALKTTHKFSTLKAVLTWITPGIIGIIIILVVGISLLTTIIGTDTIPYAGTILSLFGLA